MARQSVPRISTTKAITLDYQGLKVHFTEDAWFNATEAAAKHGKRVDTWLKTKDTRRYIAALEGVELDQLNSTDWRYLKTTKGRIGGTWMHPRLAVVFARWLDVRFAIWCDEQIFALLRGTHTHSNPPRTGLLADKRRAHNPMMEELQEWRAEQGKTTETYHYTTENRLCNWAVFGDFKAHDESAMTNEELTLLGRVREHNTHLIAGGVDYAERKAMLHRFAVRMRTRLLAIQAPA